MQSPWAKPSYLNDKPRKSNSNTTKNSNSKNSKKGLGHEIYDGAASFGRFMSIVSLVVGSIIAIILLIIGFYLLFTKTKYTAETDGKVIGVRCGTNNSGKGYSCTGVVEYTVNNIVYKMPLNTGTLYEGQAFKIVYVPSEPAKAQIKGISRQAIGGILIAIAFVVFGLAFLHYYIVNRFKFAAAASGVGTGIDMVT